MSVGEPRDELEREPGGEVPPPALNERVAIRASRIKARFFLCFWTRSASWPARLRRDLLLPPPGAFELLAALFDLPPNRSGCHTPGQPPRRALRAHVATRWRTGSSTARPLVGDRHVGASHHRHGLRITAFPPGSGQRDRRGSGVRDNGHGRVALSFTPLRLAAGIAANGPACRHRREPGHGCRHNPRDAALSRARA